MDPLRCVLIVNPTAGRRRAAFAPERLLARLRRYDARAEMVCTRQRGDAEAAAREAAERGFTRVVVAGGDGTLHEAANGLRDSPLPLCMVPCGTANVIAREMGLPFEPEAALALLAEGRPRALDAGLASGRTFLLAAGIGLDAVLIRGLSLPLKRRIGIAAYWLAGLRCLPHARPAACRLTVDGVAATEPLYGALVCNTAHYAGRYCLSPEARPDDGLLDLYLLQARNFAGLARMLLAFACDRVPACPLIAHRQVRAVACAADPTMPFQLDGDLCGETPLSITVAPGALRLLVPADGGTTPPSPL